MSESLNTHVLVVGGGPGGYVAAIRAGQLGLDCTLVEAGRLGGTCLIRGCIPSKALIHAADTFAELTAVAAHGHLGIALNSKPSINLAETVRWKSGIVNQLNTGVAGLLRRAKVQVIEGWAVFHDAKTCRVTTAEGPVEIRAQHVVLANGSVPVELSDLPFGGDVISSSEALDLTKVPETLAVVGAGYVGLELGIAFAKLGTKVTVVEAQDRILPLYDAALTEPVIRSLQKLGFSMHLGARALGFANGVLSVDTRTGGLIDIPAERVLVTVGRRPSTEGWGRENMALEMAGPFVKVDDRCATSTTGVWAIGDLVGEPMLAHKASAQGALVAEIIAGSRNKFDPVAIASVCFTDPEIVSVGMNPFGAAAQGDVVTGQFPFKANGRALSTGVGGDTGFVRVVARKSDHRILGIQAVGRDISEFAGQFATLMEMGAVLEDVAGIVHAHPTRSEAIHEAALSAIGHAIHI
ncbi:MAG: dihydrolipoyl dehydrogenase [Hyphomonadaceae bacterium]|nr:dihydrolipoyl dehydrogenase [Hyphomonadaceae bacterium]